MLMRKKNHGNGLRKQPKVCNKAFHKLCLLMCNLNDMLYYNAD